MNWLNRVAQTYSIEDVIQGVLNNTFDINWASEFLARSYGADACDALEYAAGVDATALPKMRVLAQGAGCADFEPNLPGQPVEIAQPEFGAVPELGIQEKPMNMPSVEIA